MSDQLIERLKKPVPGYPTGCVRSKDWHEAADTIETLQARIAELDAALDVCNQMILEVNHAQSNGSDWYTKGESGLYQQVSMWIGKASDAIKKARAGE